MHIQAEANLSALIESTQDLIWSVDLDDRLVTFNGALQRHIESTYGRRLAVGMFPRDFVPPQRANLLPPLYERARAQGSLRIEFPLPDGRTLDLALSPIVVDGKVTGVSVFGKDITEQKTAESALREADKKYRDIFDGALEGMFQTSPKGKPLTVNLALAKMLGYESPAEYLSLIHNVAHDVWTDPNERALYLQQLKENGTILGFECQFKRKDGTSIWASLNTRRVCQADGQLLYHEGFVLDISERKRAEQAQREGLDTLRETELVGALGSYVLDIPTGVWTSSEALDEFFGIGKEYKRDVAGWAALIHPDDRAMMTAYFADEVVGKRKAFDKQYRILRQTDGAEFWVHGMGRLEFDAQGMPLKMRGMIKDVTEHKRAEQALAASEHRFRTFFEENGSVMFLADPQTGEIVAANRAACEFYGYPKQRLVGMFTRQITLSSPEECLRDRQRALREERSCFCYSHRVASGEVREVELHSSPFEVDGRQLLYAIVNDITERKQAEIQRRNSEEHYRSTFEQAAVGIIHASFEGVILRCNARFAEMVGYSAEQLTGIDVQQITAPEDGPPSRRVLEQVLSGGAPLSLEKRYLRKDGNPTWAKLTLSIQRDGEGRSIYFTGLVEDINARKAAEERLAAAGEALRMSEERFRATFEQAAVGIIHTSLDGRILRCNERFAEIVGYPLEEVPRLTFQRITPPEDLEESVDVLQKMLDGTTRNASWEKRYLRKDGSLTWARLTVSTLRDDDGRALHFIAVVEDINARKTAEQSLATATEALRLSEERYRNAFQNSLDAININRLSDGKYIEVNQAFLDITGFEREEVIGKTSLELGIWVEARDRHLMVEMVRQNSSYRSLEIQFRKKSGSLFWGQMSASRMEVEGVPCVLSVTRDLSESKAAQSEIRSLAFYDPLTGLSNRRMVTERLRQTLSTSARGGRLHALLLIDLDNLKTLNDTLGRQVGDLVLQEVARRIAACAHEADAVGRLGGDEFVVMLEDLSEVAEEAAAEARAAGMRILTAVSQPYLLDDRECLSASSMGITVFGDQQKSADDILQQADIALHMAKTAGRNTLRFFSPALQAAVNARATMEEGLRQAIKREQFLLYYQPQIERGRMTGAEALIRWNHPGRGIVSPDEFIPLAEESRLILPLGDWVVETACKQIASWAAHDQTAHLTISVNISALQFRQPEFVGHVLAALDRTGANPKNLKLELTESMLVENFEEIIAKMTELKSHGLSFSLDDFGTGYSSLAYLKRLPLDQLKIDRAFVRDILVDVTSGAIAQTILSLGRAMDLSVVAEGVETEEQRGFLAGLGCHCFQGDLFSPPLPLEGFQAYL